MFVPVITPPPSPPSRHARELAGLLAQVAEDYSDENPDATSEDVQQAFDVAREHLRPAGAGSVCRTRAALVIGGLLAFMLALGFFMMRRAGAGGAGGGGGGAPTPWIMVAAVGGVVVLLALVALRRR